MKRFLLILPFFIFINVWSQNYDRIDSLVRNYPKSFNSIDAFTNRISRDFKTDIKRVRAVYVWMATNIRYGYNEDKFDLSKNYYIYNNDYDFELQKRRRKNRRLEKILKNKKGVCVDYSQFFKEVCDRLNIESKVITGFSKISINDINSNKNYKDHAWNAVKINNVWRLIDITWSCGYFIDTVWKKDFNDFYFFTSPEVFINTHYPINSNWQLTNSIVSKEDFFDTPILYPEYYKNNIKLAKNQTGLLKTEANKIKIHFDSIRGKVYYAFGKDKYLRKMLIKRSKKDTLYGSIRYRNNDSDKLIIFSDTKPLALFKVIN